MVNRLFSWGNRRKRKWLILLAFLFFFLLVCHFALLLQTPLYCGSGHTSSSVLIHQHLAESTFVRTSSLLETSDQQVTHQVDVMKKVLVGAGVVPGLTNFSFARLTAGQTVQFHSHPSKFEVFYCQSGQGEFVIAKQQQQQDENTTATESNSSSNNSGSGREVVGLGPGTCVVVGPHEEHSIVNTSKEEDLVLLYFGVATTNLMPSPSPPPPSPSPLLSR